MEKWNRIAMAWMALAAVPAVSFAGIVTASLTAPTDNVVASYDAASSGNVTTFGVTRKDDGGAAAQNRMIAFTFRPDASGYQLTSLTLRAKEAQNFSQSGYTPFSIALLRDTNNDGFGDSTVWQESFSPGGTWAVDNYITFAFTTPTAALTTDLYQFELYFDSEGSRNGFKFERATNGGATDDDINLYDIAPYTTPETFPYTGTAWSTSNADKRNPTFYVAAIPEPATLGLLSSCGVLLFLRRRLTI